MRERWVLFVAARHFRTKRREKGHTASILSVGGIAAGVMTLIVVLAVMNGFQLGTINDILELNSYHLRVRFETTGFEEQALPERIAQTSELLNEIPGVRSAVEFADVHALARGYFDDPQAVVIRALPADVRERDPGFAESLAVVAGTFDLASVGAALVGEELARRLGLRVGDNLLVVNFSSNSTNVVQPEEVNITVSGVFHTGFLEYDAGWVVVSLDTAAESLGFLGSPSWGIKLSDRYADRQVEARISESDSDLTVESWRDFNRAIFSALRLEKTLMMLLVGLIFVVVAVNIYQSLRRSVIERTDEIGVLKAIGARPTTLQLVFVVEGLWIGILGATIGTLLGLLISVNINEVFVWAERVVNGILTAGNWIAQIIRVGDAAGQPSSFSIFSPAYFYLDSVPAVALFGEVLGIYVFAVASATLAALGASRRVSRIEPARVLRFE